MQRLPPLPRPARARHAPFLAALLALPALAQDPAVGYSDRFDAPGIHGRVFAVGTRAGELYAGGPFDFLSGDAKLHHIARFDGREWRQVGGGLDGDVRAIVEFQGELVAAGEFGVTGTNVRVAAIARWNGTRWAPLGQGLVDGSVPAEVFALAVHQGQLYAGGRFDTAGGQPASRLARWDGTAWHPVGGGVSGGPEPKVLCLHSDGTELFVGGEFDAAGGIAAQSVAAWDGSRWRAFGSGLKRGVFALEHYRGELYAGGTFAISGSTVLRHIARWDAAAGAWQPLGLGIPDYGVSSQVGDLQVHGDQLWVSGVFDRVDAASSGSGIVSPSIARWDGTRWHGGLGLFQQTFGGDAVGIAMTEWDGRLVIGGEFDHAGPVGDFHANVVSKDVIAWNGSGFEVLGEGLGLGEGTSGLLRWRGSLWSIENHHHAGSVVSPRVARFDGSRWHVVGPFDPLTDIDDAIVFQGDLHVSGDLRFADGRRMSGVIRYDGTTWTPIGGPSGGVLAEHGGELYCGGTGFVQRLTASGWTPLPPLLGHVETMCSFAGALYIGGSNLRVSGGPVTNLLVFDGSTLAPVGNGLDDSVHVLHEHGGELWIGGRFTLADGIHSPYLARWDGSRYLAFPGLAQGSFVHALESLGSELFLSGNLGTVGGTETTLAAWDGTTLRALGSGPNAPASTLLADASTGELWIGGGFFLCDGRPSAGLTVWHTTPHWGDLGRALPRSDGVTPRLDGFGALRSGETIAWRGFGLLPNQPATLVVGGTRLDQPLFGGMMVPALHVTIALPVDAVGALRVDLQLPAAVPAGATLFSQVWGIDVQRHVAFATNAVVAR